MWICQRCRAENRDSASACQACGAVRAAGRFGSAPQQRPVQTVQPPRVTPPVSPSEPEVPTAPRGGYQAPEQRMPKIRKKRAPLLSLACLTGGALCVLLPLLTALWAWTQRDTLHAELLPLLGADAPVWLGWTVYAATTLTAVLLSLLPGLWTLLLAKRKEG